MKKDHQKYRGDTIRAKWWNYSQQAMYFVTVNTKNRVRWFGEVDGNMQLSFLGAVVQMEWLKTFELRKDMNLHKGAYVVMPDHFHALIGIGENRYNAFAHAPRKGSSLEEIDKRGEPLGHFGPQRKNLASVIRGFYSDFAWQARYYDRIIRHQNAYQAATRYIHENPARWKG